MLYFLSPKGETLWSVDYSSNSKYFPLEVKISENAKKTLVLLSGFNEQEILFAYDFNGKLITQTEGDMGFSAGVQLSPQGDYFIANNRVYFNGREKSSIMLPGFDDTYSYDYKVLSGGLIGIIASRPKDDKILSKEIKTHNRWKRYKRIISHELGFIIYNYQNSNIIKQYDFSPRGYVKTFTDGEISLINIVKKNSKNNENLLSNLILMDCDGNEIWRKQNLIKDFYFDSSFSMEYITIRDNRTIFILKKSTGELFAQFKLSLDENLTTIKTLYLLNGSLFICGKKVPQGLINKHSYDGYWSIRLDFDRNGELKNKIINKGFLKIVSSKSIIVLIDYLTETIKTERNTTDFTNFKLNVLKYN